jgi:hypothetical protein
MTQSAGGEARRRRSRSPEQELGMQIDEVTRYAQLAAGARYLAAESRSRAEREEHLGMAVVYARRRAQLVRWETL